ncbi:MAG: MerR family transcriptional regulator [Saprospiraceae bacterium]|nr:MerR family transcriptional regulator [Saprospiraceae bacterium]
MTTYSIKDLEKLTGIKAHTIRIWEQRYNIIEPKRTKTNIRYYTDADVKFILNVAVLNKSGLRISKIAKLSHAEISQKVSSISHDNFENTTQLQALTIAMMELDEYKFEQIMQANIEQEGFESTMVRIVVPFLEKLSLLWLTGSISTVHEQFINCLIRQKIIAAINDLPIPTRDSKYKRFIVYLPKGEGEEQEVLLLLAYYLLRMRKHTVLYLGTGIELGDLTIAHELHKPDYIYTIVSDNKGKEHTHKYVTKLIQRFPSTSFLLSGYYMRENVPVSAPSISMLEDFNDVVSFFNNLEFK